MQRFGLEKTKPIQSQFQTRRRIWCGRIEIATVATLLRNDISGLFEKTKPIFKNRNEHKYLQNKELRECCHIQAAEKQSQTKPIFLFSCRKTKRTCTI